MSNCVNHVFVEDTVFAGAHLDVQVHTIEGPPATVNLS